MDDYHERKSFNLHVLRSKIVLWKQGHEDNEHSQRAVDFLVKKLKNSDGKFSLRLSIRSFNFLLCRRFGFVGESVDQSESNQSVHHDSALRRQTYSNRLSQRVSSCCLLSSVAFRRSTELSRISADPLLSLSVFTREQSKPKTRLHQSVPLQSSSIAR